MNSTSVAKTESQSSEHSDHSDFAVVDRDEVAEAIEKEVGASDEKKNLEDTQKISVPDPSLADDYEEVVASRLQDDTSQSMMEGAWADILGSGQLKKKVLKPGQPNSRPVNMQLCAISISGVLQDGKEVDVNENLKFHLGDHDVIQGIDLAVALMDLGEVCQLEIGPRFAYGSHGKKDEIPADATILYTVELKEVSQEKDLEEVTIDERLKIGNSKRERGNWWYSRGDNTSAIQCYRRALEYLDTENETETDSADKLQEVLDDRLKVYNNMAAAQMKIEAYDAALKSIDLVLRCQKDNVKAIYRKAKILAATMKINEAVALLERALHLDPSSKIIQQDLARLQARRKLEVQKEKSLYKKMFGNDTNTAKTTPQDKAKVKLGVPWTLMAGTIVAVIASYVTYRFKYL